MTTWKHIQSIALGFPESKEEAHFEKTSFRVKKKIFATFDKKQNLLCVKLSEIDQRVFSTINKQAIYPVPNKWGRLGWTYIHCELVQTEMLKDLLSTAYCEVAPQKFSEHMKLKKP